MVRAAFLVLLLYGGAVVDRKIVSEQVRVALDDAPENSTRAVQGTEGSRLETVYKPESLHLPDTLSTSEAVILAKDNNNDKGRENSVRGHLQPHWKSDLR